VAGFRLCPKGSPVLMALVALMVPVLFAGSVLAAEQSLNVPETWKRLLTTGRSVEVSTDPGFGTTFFEVKSNPWRKVADFDQYPSLKFPPFNDDQVLFWRFRDPKGNLRQHPGIFIVVPANGAVWINLGADARWDVFVSENAPTSFFGRNPDKIFSVTGSSVFLTAGDKPWTYRIAPAFNHALIRQLDGRFPGLQVARVSKIPSAESASGAIAQWKAERVLYPPGGKLVSDKEAEGRPGEGEVPEFVGPLGEIIDPREPTRDSVSSVRLLGKYLREDLVIKRSLEFAVSGAKSIGGALRIEDVGFYPASIFADFEWHGVHAQYEGSPSGQPPELIKHVFGGLMIGYDLGVFFPDLVENQIALHAGPQFSLVSVPVTADFEPKGFVGIRLQPQVIRFGAVWYANIQAASRGDGSLTHLAAGYLNCRYAAICLSGEAYRRIVEIKSGTNETRLVESGVAIGFGKNL